MLGLSDFPDSISLFGSSGTSRGVSNMVGGAVLVGLVVVAAAGLGTVVLGSTSTLDRAPQISFGVQEATDAASDEILIDHSGGPEMNAENAIIKIKRGGNTLVTLNEGQDTTMSVGDTMVITSDGSSTTVNFAGEKAFSSSSSGFDLNKGQVTVLIIDKGSNREIASLTVEG